MMQYTVIAKNYIICPSCSNMNLIVNKSPLGGFEICCSNCEEAVTSIRVPREQIERVDELPCVLMDLGVNTC